MIESFNISGPMHTDFYQENLGSQVVSYALSICAKCLFIGAEEGFRQINDNIRRESSWEELRELEKKYPASKRYIILAEKLEKEGISKEELGHWYLKASWAERMAEERERSLDSIALEKEYLGRALKYFGEALEVGEMEDW